MNSRKKSFIFQNIWYWIVGFAAVIWMIFRSGANPKRLTYPCQKVAMPVAVNWLIAVTAFWGGSMFLQRFAKVSAPIVLVGGLIWFAGVLPESPEAKLNTTLELPTWEVSQPISKVLVLDDIPQTTGSLAKGNASVPDAYLSDPAIDTLITMLNSKGIYLHKTVQQSEGIVGSDNIVVIGFSAAVIS